MSFQAVSAGRPRVGLLLTQDRAIFDAYFGDFLIQLRLKANVQELTASSAAIDAFSGTSESSPSIILAMDGTLANPEASTLLDHASDFVSRGGTLIFGGPFSSLVDPHHFEPLFSSFGLPWEFGESFRTTHALNPSAAQQMNTTGLAARYSQNAKLLRYEPHASAIYLPSKDSGEDLALTPAALASSGQGKVGYVGDVKTQAETNAVMLAMCGLN